MLHHIPDNFPSPEVVLSFFHLHNIVLHYCHIQIHNLHIIFAQIPASDPLRDTPCLSALLAYTPQYKCDIFRVFAQEDPVDTTGFSAEQVGQEAVSDVVYESILGHYCIKKQERKTGLDVWVSFLSFFFDLNFAESLRIALKQGYYKKRFSELKFEDPATEERVRRCIAETEQYAYVRLRMEELQ